MLILDLCGGTGSWSKPYRDAGYDVRIVDILNGDDVRLFEKYNRDIHGILAAPPCTDLSGSGARWWASKGPEALTNALAIADACVRIAFVHKPVWWALENPVGRLRKYYGDPYTKKTLIWGNFNMPEKRPVEPTEGSKLWRLPPSPDRWRLRSMTPQGFARAFFEANP